MSVRGQSAAGKKFRFADHSRLKAGASRRYGLLVIPATSLALGVWQIQRHFWKQDLIKSLDERSSAPPWPLVECMDRLDELEYRKVSMTGSFDHTREAYIGPRSLIVKGGSAAASGAFSQSGNVGWHVVTAFRLSQANVTVLVNRGWVAKEKMLPDTRSQGQIPGVVELSGVVRKPEKLHQFIPKTDPASQSVWSNRDVDQIAATLGTAAIFIDADELSSVPGGPIGGQTLVKLSDNHLSYILTWFGLSAATFYMWLARQVR